MNSSPKPEPQLDEAANQKLQNAVEDITQRELADEDKALGLVALYTKYGLNAKAIEILERLVATGIKLAEIHFALGEVYGNSDSNIQAKEQFQKALELALANQSPQVVVAAKAGLAKIEAVNRNMGAANRWRQEAQAGFESLKDVEKRSEMGERLRRLISGEQQFMLLNSGECGVCAGPGQYFFRKCIPCN